MTAAGNSGNDEPLYSDAGGRTAEPTNVSGAPFASTNGKSGGGGSSSSGAGASIYGSQNNVDASRFAPKIDPKVILELSERTAAMATILATPHGQTIMSAIWASGYTYNIEIMPGFDIDKERDKRHANNPNYNPSETDQLVGLFIPPTPVDPARILIAEEFITYPQTKWLKYSTNMTNWAGAPEWEAQELWMAMAHEFRHFFNWIQRGNGGDESEAWQSVHIMMFERQYNYHFLEHYGPAMFILRWP